MQNERLRILKAKNMRRIITRELSGFVTDINLDSFISVDVTKLLTERVYAKLDLAEIKILVDKDIGQCKNFLNMFKGQFSDFFECKGILMHYWDREVGAIILNTEDFFDNIDYMFRFTKFSEGYTDLFLWEKSCNLEYASRDLSITMY